VWQRNFKSALFSPSGILSDKIIENLASVGPVLRLIKLECVVVSQWPWFGKYGDELLTALLHMSIPPVKPKHQGQARGTKRPVGDCTEESPDRDDHGPKRKRSRVKQPAREKHCDPTIVNLPISTATPIPPVTHPTPVPLPIPATPIPLNYTTPSTHSQYPPMYPYSSYYISPHQSHHPMDTILLLPTYSPHISNHKC
jgi:hypothetical protein